MKNCSKALVVVLGVASFGLSPLAAANPNGPCEKGGGCSAKIERSAPKSEKKESKTEKKESSSESRESKSEKKESKSDTKTSEHRSSHSSDGKASEGKSSHVETSTGTAKSGSNTDFGKVRERIEKAEKEGLETIKDNGSR